jgi:acetylornithine deacetylase
MPVNAIPVESIDALHAHAVELLKKLISTPSFSREEAATADLIENFLKEQGQQPQREGNNVWCVAENSAPDASLLLLNSHHDTVKPVNGWQRDPFTPQVEGDKLYGLGSNDAGASAVSLLAAFLYLSKQESLPYKLIVAITAEEEVSGSNGVQAILPKLGEVAVAVVGEPTLLDMAVAEKGLIVIDCKAQGKAGHAARGEGENALYKALDDIHWFRNYRFAESSELLGPVKLSVTQIQAGYQHNVVPDECSYVVDVRPNECYSNQEIVDIIRAHVGSEVNPRSLRLNSSGIPLQHPLVQKARELGKKLYGSPTLSDQALMPFHSVKIGPGDSARSHTADEYIGLSEIREGIETYIRLLQDLQL